MDDFTVTTIYFDGQFWAALIEKSAGGRLYTGRYVFGAEPSNPRVINWIVCEFEHIRLYPSAVPVHIKTKRMCAADGTPKSLNIYKAAQSAYFRKRKKSLLTEKKKSAQERWELDRKKHKEKKRH